MTSSPSKPRVNTLSPPSTPYIAKALGVEAVAIDWLAGDGSDRCYYRIHSPALREPLVLMQLSGSDAIALQKGGYDWIKIADLLQTQGVFVPRVIAAMPDHAALIIEDYGNQMLESLILAYARENRLPEIKSLYHQCCEVLAKFLGIPRSNEAIWCKRSFDAERFTWELNFFVQKYATPIAGVQLTAAERGQFDKEVAILSDTLAANSQYFVHRDFHSRNIMVKGDTLAVIDFQDARLGPASYDLVSLCFDAYVPFTSELRSALLDEGLQRIRTALGPKVHAETKELWKPMLLQRQLKAIGSFGYLTIDKHRGNYLKYVEPALATLEGQNLRDERWPFISDTLLKRMRHHLNQNGNSHGLST